MQYRAMNGGIGKASKRLCPLLELSRTVGSCGIFRQGKAE